MFAILTRRLVDRSEYIDKRPSDDSVFLTHLYQNYKFFLFKKAGMYTNDLCAKEDIVQSAVLRLIDKAEMLRTLTPAALVTYLALTVRSAALNYLRTEQRERLDAIPLPDTDDEEYFPFDVKFQPTAEEWVLLNLSREEVRAAIEHLPARDRIALTGKYYLQLDNPELAEMLGVTAGTLRTLLSRARGRVLKELGKERVFDE